MPIPSYLRSTEKGEPPIDIDPNPDGFEPDRTQAGSPVVVVSHERRRTRDVIKNGMGEKIIVTRRKHARAFVRLEDETGIFMSIPDSTAERVSPKMVNPKKRNRILREEAEKDRDFLPKDLL